MDDAKNLLIKPNKVYDVDVQAFSYFAVYCMMVSLLIRK